MTAVNELLSRLIRPVRLLCVEDDTSFALMLQRTLQTRYVCTVDNAVTGEEALEMVKRNRYDVVLLDLLLPGMSGVDVLRQLKLLSKAIPVIVITGNLGTALAEEAAHCGVVTFVEKPFETEDLDEIFGLFKIRARTTEDDAYLKSCASTPDYPYERPT